MQEIPKRKVGDKVRIMQTEEMHELGLANLTGTVIEILSENSIMGDECLIKIDSEHFPNAEPIKINSCSLMGA